MSCCVSADLRSASVPGGDQSDPLHSEGQLRNCALLWLHHRHLGRLHPHTRGAMSLHVSSIAGLFALDSWSEAELHSELRRCSRR